MRADRIKTFVVAFAVDAVVWVLAWFVGGVFFLSAVQACCFLVAEFGDVVEPAAVEALTCRWDEDVHFSSCFPQKNSLRDCKGADSYFN